MNNLRSLEGGWFQLSDHTILLPTTYPGNDVELEDGIIIKNGANCGKLNFLYYTTDTIPLPGDFALEELGPRLVASADLGLLKLATLCLQEQFPDLSFFYSSFGRISPPLSGFAEVFLEGISGRRDNLNRILFEGAKEDRSIFLANMKQHSNSQDAELFDKVLGDPRYVSIITREALINNYLL